MELYELKVNNIYNADSDQNFWEATVHLPQDFTGSIETFDRMAMELSSDARGEGLLVLACDANGWTPEALDPLLRALPKPVFGGVFPHIIHESRNHERGTLVLGHMQHGETPP